MIKEKKAYVYRIEIDNRYGWFVSTYSSIDFDKVIKKQISLAKRITNDTTEIQGKLLEINDYKDVTFQTVGIVDQEDYIRKARIIINDMRSFNPSQILNQRIPNLYFYVDAALKHGVNMDEMIELMHTYPQVDFGWPINEAKYEEEMNSDSSKQYAKIRMKVLRYWFNQSNGNLGWIYNTNKMGNNIATRNYVQAYQNLEQLTPVNIKDWYYDETSKTVGLVWHFTDINNMANILSYREIASKNWGTESQIIENDNAASSVNDTATKPWVHNYARFYLRPKTPTQYRNEGIYQYYGNDPDFRKMPQSLTNREQSGFWTVGRLAHLPVPVFIGFGLQNFLKRGGYLTKGSLAGNRVSDNPSEMFDNDFSFFKKYIKDIYSDQWAPNYLKHTEFIFKNRIKFYSNDILKIVVRSEAEKLVLLTLLTEHDCDLFSDKNSHCEVDPQRYINRIEVNPNFFYSNGSVVRCNPQVANSSNQYNLCLIPSINPENLKREENEYQFTKQVNDHKLYVSVTKLKQITLKVRDVNNEIKTVARYHDPDWILGITKWIPSRQNKQFNLRLKNRYYSSLYYHHKYLKLWREEGTNKWYFVKTNQPENVIKLEDRAILKEVEESLQEYLK